jgi:hypothetical protein
VYQSAMLLSPYCGTSGQKSGMILISPNDLVASWPCHSLLQVEMGIFGSRGRSD